MNAVRVVGRLVVALIVIAVTLVVVGGAITIGIFMLKVLLFALLLSWLARKLFGWGGRRGRRSARTDLVGPPVADIAAPAEPRRDKYDIAAERELDEELGL